MTAQPERRPPRGSGPQRAHWPLAIARVRLLGASPRPRNPGDGVVAVPTLQVGNGVSEKSAVASVSAGPQPGRAALRRLAPRERALPRGAWAPGREESGGAGGGAGKVSRWPGHLCPLRLQSVAAVWPQSLCSRPGGLPCVSATSAQTARGGGRGGVSALSQTSPSRLAE